jgi:uncharacterized protein YlzI (FlbEa/FlbD family)
MERLIELEVMKLIEFETCPGEYVERVWLNPEEVSSIATNSIHTDTIITMTGGEAYLVTLSPVEVMRKLDIEY